MPEIVGLFLVGIINGLTVCSLSCMHYLAPFLLSTGNGFKDGVSSSAFYLSGKVVSYGALGGFAAYLGKIVTENLNHSGRYIMGGSLIVFALILPLFKQKSCAQKGGKSALGRRFSLFGIGISTSLVPCPALASLFLLAADNGSILMGLLFGLVYGMGLMVSPLLIAGGGIALIAQKINLEVNEFMPYLRGLSMIVILLLGVNLILQ